MMLSRAVAARVCGTFALAGASARRNFRTSGSVTDLSVAAFGASTDVGKTIICAGLCRAALARGQRVAYIKPVQTGDELDEYFVREYTNPEGNKDISCETLFRRNSAGVISNNEQQQMSDADVQAALRMLLTQFHTDPSKTHSFAVIETAGGVLSPGPSSALQADLYRPFRHPVVLVGDTRLGGITSTLTALEALMLRGFTVHAVCLILQQGATSLVNTEVLRRYSNPGIPIYQFSQLPTDRLLHAWFQDNEQQFHDMFTTLWSDVQNEMSELRHLKGKAQDLLWWDGSRHIFQDGLTFVESSLGDSIKVVGFAEDGSMNYRSQLYASVLAQGVGAGNRGMALALAHAAGRYGQMISCGVYPANVTLSERLLNSSWGPGFGWAKRAMFSENASVAMESAITIAQKVYHTKISHSTNSGGGEVQAGDAVHSHVLTMSQHCMHRRNKTSAPRVAWENGSLQLDQAEFPEFDRLEDFPSTVATLFDVQARIQGPLADAYRKHISAELDTSEPFAALVLQPLANIGDQVWFVDPLFQKVLIQECRARGMIIICDEITTGLWRLGRVSSSEYLGELPDIAVHGRLMTGGYVDLGLVLATEEVYQASHDSIRRDIQALNPLSAMAGLEVLQQYRSCDQYDADTNSMCSPWPEHEVKELSRMPGVVSTMSLGHVLLVELQQASSKDQVVAYLHKQGVHVHARGNTITALVTPMTGSRACTSLLHSLRHALGRMK